MTTSCTPQRQAELISNWKNVTERIEKVSKDKPRLVAVSKLKPASDIQALYDAGQRHFGENYVQELQEKAKQLPDDIQWHFIGGLQTNKSKILASIPNMYAVETIDTLKKAEQISKHREASDSKVSIFIQVNTSGEESKSGVEPKDTIELLKQVKELEKIHLSGLMTIGRQDWDKSKENPDFKLLRELRDQAASETGLSLELSMGMSDDFEQAIEMGSTNVRVGSTIFGARPPKN